MSWYSFRFSTIDLLWDCKSPSHLLSRRIDRYRFSIDLWNLSGQPKACIHNAKNLVGVWKAHLGIDGIIHSPCFVFARVASPNGMSLVAIRLDAYRQAFFVPSILYPAYNSWQPPRASRLFKHLRVESTWPVSDQAVVKPAIHNCR